LLQLLQHLGDGRTELVEVPAPGPREGALLVHTTRSLISAGTERMLVEFGKAGWLGKARQQPEKVRAVLDKIRANGLLETLRAVRAKLNQPIPLGYCQVGTVIAVDDDGSQLLDKGYQKKTGPPLSAVGSQGAEGSQLSVQGYRESAGRSANQEPITTNQELSSDAFRVGDRVVSNGPHAEAVSVAQALCAKVPEGVSDEAASFTPLCAIALQGINLLAVAPGDKVVVTGLGLIGQLASRILLARGCEVLGLDPSPERRTLAEKSGIKTATGAPASAALAWTKGEGVAGVLITASTSSDEVVSQSARSCRHRGKVVLVGVVGLQLNRVDFYRNEVSFQVSCSYGRRESTGPGSARDNFNRVLALMAAGKLPVEDLITHRFELREASAAYAALGDPKALGVLMTYDANSESTLNRTIQLGNGREKAQKAQKGTYEKPTVRVGVIGAGNFAMRTLLPAMMRLPTRPALAAVASTQGAPALLAARAFGAERATTDVESLLGDPGVKAVFITTRHDAHAAQAAAALRAGKHVWVEKPLCLTLEELRSIETALSPQLPAPSSPIFMVGFNRRFAPMAVALKRALATRPGPRRFTMTVNAGRLEPGHWALDPRAGGGRIVGEVCHFVDLMCFLAGAPIETVHCTRRDDDGQDGGAFELGFAGGSTGLIDYRTDLPAHLPKEIVEVSGDVCSARIFNWSRLSSQGMGGLSGGGFWNRGPRKGHPEAVRSFLGAVGGGPEPIPLGDILEVSRWSIVMQGMGEGDLLTANDTSGHE